jgi:hypothetical protein
MYLLTIKRKEKRLEMAIKIIKDMKCIWRFGTWLEGLISVLTLGHGTAIAGWVAWTFFKNPDCGCTRRKEYLDNLFGCHNGIKLN